MLSLREMKECVLENALRAYALGLFAGTSGNLSLRDGEGKLVAITPSSLPYEKMGIDDIMIIDLASGAAVEGKHKPSSEWRVHTAIMKGRPDVRGVVHTHSPYATSFAVLCRPIPLVLIEMLGYIGGDIPVSGFEQPGSEALGITVAATLKNRNACLMRNHGAVAVGRTLEQALLRAIYVEDAAKIYSLALSTGGKIELIPDEAAAEMKKRLGLPD
jgi:L-ribulose-5-phosphate 4-epimerase